ncbi:uncharacterized protein LOC129303055 isoform X2 [Prosopis cineraria]|uniref:uncharacterized protein LOC129303055 isoform X2 n=1 Tax=Prosopis cineraria TaxID=364024 RepID=UPI00240F76AD|nr:uncharacterized protein LOC129303055 isoform X2 [Prosopis cineraria]
MTDQVNGLPQDPTWPELKLPELLQNDAVRQVHATIEKEWDFLQRSACQTAAGRALWKHVVRDPLAELLAGETYLRNLHDKIKKDHLNNAREISGVILAVRTLWFDSRLELALNSPNGREAQVVLLGAGMDTRAYRLSCLKDSDVFEVDFPEVLQVKATILRAAEESAKDDDPQQQQIMCRAKSLTRVAADIREDNWLEKLKISGFLPEKRTVWILEDFMNKPSTMLSSSTFHFYSDWPDHLLPSIGFAHVKLSQIGDPDAHFGLLNDPLNLFNKLLNVPRSVQTHPDDGTPCCRLYLVEASGSPDQSNEATLSQS